MAKAIILLVIGIGVLLLGMNIRKQLGSKRQRCTKSVTGRVTKLEMIKNDNDPECEMPYYTYQVDGKDYELRSDMTYAPGKIPMGEETEILVDPANPGDALIKDQLGGNKIWTVIIILLGICGIAAGIAEFVAQL